MGVSLSQLPCSRSWLYGGLLELAPFHLVVHYFGPEAVSMRLGWRSGPNTVELNRVMLGNLGPWTLAETPGGREELRELADPRLRDVVDGLSPAVTPVARAHTARGTGVVGELMDIQVMTVRLHDDEGRAAGIALTYKPAASMAVLSTWPGAGSSTSTLQPA